MRQKYLLFILPHFLSIFSTIPSLKSCLNLNKLEEVYPLKTLSLILISEQVSGDTKTHEEKRSHRPDPSEFVVEGHRLE